jgi:hypothetical protein
MEGEVGSGLGCEVIPKTDRYLVLGFRDITLSDGDWGQNRNKF